MRFNCERQSTAGCHVFLFSFQRQLVMGYQNYLSTYIILESAVLGSREDPHEMV